MATQVFFREAAARTTASAHQRGNNDPVLDAGNGVLPGAWVNPMLTARGSTKQVSAGSTMAGPTNGCEIADGGFTTEWVTPPLAAAVTISGTITFNLWASENNMNANVAINCIIERLGPTGNIISTIVKTARTTEVALTTPAVNNFTATPTSTSCAKGDRLRFRVFGDDAGTMGAAFAFNFDYGAGSGVDGDSFVTFTETFSFLTTDPTTTTLYLTNTSAGINPGTAVNEYEAWTARGSGVQQADADDVAGWRSPGLWTITQGGSDTFEWFSRQLQAFTLAGPVLVNARVANSTLNAIGMNIRAELAVTDSSGGNPTVWASDAANANNNGSVYNEPGPTTETAYTWYLAAADQAVSQGSRLRIRFYMDDGSTSQLELGRYLRLFYNGTSGGASGDTFVVFGQTLTEYVPPAGLPGPRRDRLARASRDFDPWSLTGWQQPA